MSAAINEIPVSEVASPKSARLLEIDIFRAIAICLMGVTHGYFWVSTPQKWTATVTSAGIYFCFGAFLLSFGMSLGLSARRGSTEKPGASLKTLRRAGIILIAYYIVALGRYTPEILSHGGGNRIMAYVQLLTLVQVPKAADFFLSFVFYLLFIAIVGKWLRRILEHPLLCLMVAVGLHFAGIYFSYWIVHPDGYWKILFGTREASRTFPILPYFPLFVLGMLIGDSYGVPGEPRRKLIRYAGIALICAMVAAADFLWHLRTPDYLMGTLSPVPKLTYLFGASALSLIVFLLCAVIVPKAKDKFAQYVIRFMLYVGQNSIWIIVCQYFWIQLAARILHIGDGSTVRTLAYGISMVFVPPLLLFLLQFLTKRKERPQRERTDTVPRFQE